MNKKELKRKKLISLDIEVISSVEEFARNDNRNFTNMVQHILDQYIRENKKTA